jgi:hypothetical protein
MRSRTTIAAVDRIPYKVCAKHIKVGNRKIVKSLLRMYFKRRIMH